jgi:hypothetical protein
MDWFNLLTSFPYFMTTGDIWGIPGEKQIAPLAKSHLFTVLAASRSAPVLLKSLKKDGGFKDAYPLVI